MRDLPQGTFQFWVDALGVEWLPLLRALLSEEKNAIKIEWARVASAQLPTETEFNKEWDRGNPAHLKWDRLDKLAHQGSPDDKSYFSCVAQQLEIVHKVVERAKDLLKKNEYVVITGDHGTSRMAALAFHEAMAPMALPCDNAIVRSHGRYCEIDQPEQLSAVDAPHQKRISRDDCTFIVACEHKGFKASGNIAGGNSEENDVCGETHGGNTPEERLVPVLYLRSLKLDPLTCNCDSEVVQKRKPFTLSFSRPVRCLKVCDTRDREYRVEQVSDTAWRVTLQGIPGGESKVQLILTANGQELPDRLMLKIKSTLQFNEMGDL